PSFVVEAAGRLFVDVTGLVRTETGHRFFAAMLGQMETRSGPLLRSLFADPRLAPHPIAWRHVLPAVVRLLATTRLPFQVVAAFLAPTVARTSLRRLRDEIDAAGTA